MTQDFIWTSLWTFTGSTRACTAYKCSWLTNLPAPNKSMVHHPSSMQNEHNRLLELHWNLRSIRNPSFFQTISHENTNFYSPFWKEANRSPNFTALLAALTIFKKKASYGKNNHCPMLKVWKNVGRLMWSFRTKLVPNFMVGSFAHLWHLSACMSTWVLAGDSARFLLLLNYEMPTKVLTSTGFFTTISGTVIIGADHTTWNDILHNSTALHQNCGWLITNYELTNHSKIVYGQVYIEHCTTAVVMGMLKNVFPHCNKK